MKHRIFYSRGEQLYKIETKRMFRNWETRNNYLFTDSTGNIIDVKGFFTYELAEEWINDRYPNSVSPHIPSNHNNIEFEF